MQLSHENHFYLQVFKQSYKLFHGGRWPPIFSDYKLVKNIGIATYKIEAGVTKMKQKQIKA